MYIVQVMRGERVWRYGYCERGMAILAARRKGGLCLNISLMRFEKEGI